MFYIMVTESVKLNIVKRVSVDMQAYGINI